MDYGLFYYGEPSSSRLGPGQMVMRMSADKREILKTLKSEDLQNIRPDAIWGKSELSKKKGRWGL